MKANPLTPLRTREVLDDLEKQVDALAAKYNFSWLTRRATFAEMIAREFRIGNMAAQDILKAYEHYKQTAARRKPRTNKEK